MNEIRSSNQGMIFFADIDTYREKHRLLLNALRHVETSFIMPAPTGDDGLSIGPLQIRFFFPSIASQWWILQYSPCTQFNVYTITSQWSQRFCFSRCAYKQLLEWLWLWFGPTF